jgi:hypothetical protein
MDWRAQSREIRIKSREMTGRTQTLLWWLGGEGVKTTENKKYKQILKVKIVQVVPPEILAQ